MTRKYSTGQRKKFSQENFSGHSGQNWSWLQQVQSIVSELKHPRTCSEKNTQEQKPFSEKKHPRIKKKNFFRKNIWDCPRIDCGDPLPPQNSINSYWIFQDRPKQNLPRIKTTSGLYAYMVIIIFNVQDSLGVLSSCISNAKSTSNSAENGKLTTELLLSR